MMIKERSIFISQEPYYDSYENVLNVQEFALSGEEIFVRNLLFYTVNKEMFLSETKNVRFLTFTAHLDLDTFGKMPDGFEDELLKKIYETKKNVLENAPTIPPLHSFDEFLSLCSASSFNEYDQNCFNRLLSQ